jgi:glycosyltransferase involved in cell wall biosynthesis
MRVMHVISGLGLGGAEKNLVSLLHYLEKNNVSVTSYVIILGDKKNSNKNLLSKVNAEVVHLNIKSFQSILLATLKFGILLFRIRPDYVQTWMYHSDLFAGIITRMLTRAKVLWTVRSHDISFGENKTTILIKKLCVFFSRLLPHKIIFTSEEAKVLHVNEGYPALKSYVIYNGVDIKLFKFVKQRQNQRLTIGYFGRANRIKGIDIFAEVAHNMETDGLDCSFIMQGPGLLDYGKDISVTNRKNLIILPETDDPLTFFDKVDILLLPSRSEGFSNVLLEAMATGVICVASDVGSNRFILGDAGFIVHENIPLEIVKTLIGIMELSDQELYNIRLSARKRVMDNFQNERSFALFSKLYE